MTTALRRAKIDLPFTILLDGPLAVGSGFRRGQIQRTVMRSLEDLPYIPASTLKGRVRDAAERLARSLGHEICDGPNPETMCGAAKDVEEFCLICRTFGSPGFSSVSGHTGLIWRDAPMVKELQPAVEESQNKVTSLKQGTEAFFYARTQVQLSRVRGTAQEKH